METQKENLVNFGQIFRLAMMQSKLILFGVMLVTSLSTIYYFYAEKVYRLSSLVQIFSDDNNGLSQGMTMDFYIGGSNTTDIEDIEQIYKSRKNILAIINDLKLNLETEDANFNLNKVVQNFKITDMDPRKIVRFKIKFQSDSYEIYDNSGDLLSNTEYGKIYYNDSFSITIIKPENLPENNISFKGQPAESIYKKVRNRFSIESTKVARSLYTNPFSEGGMLKIAYNSNNINKGIDILNYANSLFIKNTILDDSAQARKAIVFIDKRIEEIQKQLDEKKQNLKFFREQNKTVDVDLEIQSIVQTLSDIELKIANLDIEISTAINNYTQTNPIFKNLLDQQQTLYKQKAEIEKKIESLPLAQQEYIDLFSDLEISEEVFTVLQNKRLEFSIKEASTLGNIRIIDNGYYDEKISPSIIIIFAAFIVSSVLFFIISIFRGLFFLPITNPAEIADNSISIPILGVVAKVIDEDNSNEKFSQAVESLIVNVNTIMKEKNKDGCKVISITSPTASNGKTFISKNFSSRLAASDVSANILLIDADYKRGDQHKEFGVEKITEKEFFDINESNLDKYKISDRFYLIPKITRLRSSFDFLYSAEFSEKLNFLKSKFDYIIFDTAPILSVSDTSVIQNFADFRLFVVRHGVTRINEIKQSAIVFNQIGLEPDGVIYNGYEKPSSYYGYYGYYGNYSYQYYANRYLYNSYDYDKREN